MNTPRIYVACLACYNEGKLVGKWFDLDDVDDATPEAIHDGPTDHEEYMVHDTENLPAPWNREMGLSEAAELADALDCLENHQPIEAFAAWVANGCGAVEDLNRFGDEYMGEYASEADYLEEQAEDCGDLDKLPQHIRYHIDWEGVARDDQSIWSAPAGPGRVYIFRN